MIAAPLAIARETRFGFRFGFGAALAPTCSLAFDSTALRRRAG